MERVKKWLKMMKQWEQIRDNEKLRRRVFKGIPNSLRGQVWSRILNLDRVKGEQKGKYQVFYLALMNLFLYLRYISVYF